MYVCLGHLKVPNFYSEVDYFSINITNIKNPTLQFMTRVALIAIITLISVLAAPATDEVKSLKGYYDFSQEFQMYSGYLTLQ